MNHPLRLFLLATLVATTLAACGGGSKSKEPSRTVEPGDFDDLYAYKTNSPYANVIKQCVSAEDVDDACTLATLPVIGMENEAPDIAAIMDRVVVSHAWMGERFEEVLNSLPAEMLPIFRAVTAVVIDDDIRPAFYTTLTGAIYLDPAYLWTLASEAQTINSKADYRAGYADPLAFRSRHRYVIGNDYAYRWTFLGNATDRSLDDILVLIANLILHELAHANDNFPPGSYANLDPQSKIAYQAGARSSIGISQRLTNSDPLTSSTLYSLAGVMYRGVSPTASDLAITGAEVGAAFEVDAAADDYAYTSQFEDVAMLFEEAMMKYFFNADHDVAYTTAPQEGEEGLCSGYPMEWGVRNRLGDSAVKARAEFVVNKIYPNLDTEAFFENFPLPQDLNLDGNWCDSIVLNSSSAARREKPQTDNQVDPSYIDRPFR